MRRLLRWAALLYPAAWRARYGVEFELLVTDADSRWMDLFDVLRGALAMQMTSLNFWKIAAGFALAGALTAGAWSLTLPERYVSIAMLRLSDPAGLRTLQQSALSRHSLSGIIQEQKLYGKERRQKPLEDIVQTMRARDLHVQAFDRGAFSVSFEGQDAATAQATVRAVVSAMVEANFARREKVNLQVIEPASLPGAASGPNRVRMIRNGLIAGLLVGVVVGVLFSIVRKRKQWSLARIGLFAITGMAIGLAVAMMIPDEFVSSAVLRTTEGDQLSPAIAAALSDASLQDVIVHYDLYATERRSTPIAKVAGGMRGKAIRLQMLDMPVGTGARAFTIAFIYPDRYKAQAVTRELVTRISGQVPSEVLDPASAPNGPSYPNRLNMALTGLFAGMLLGLAATHWRPTPLATA